MKHIILASKSPRRRELLSQIGVEYVVDTVDVDESIINPKDYNSIGEYVMELSFAKAKPVLDRHEDAYVIGADTIVTYDNKVLGKPNDELDAINMLTELSGRVHQVYTGVSILHFQEGKLIRDSFYEVTDVIMGENSSEIIQEYVATGEPMDKAGAYGIQGIGAILVQEIKGDYNNVVGLPLSQVYRHLNNV